MGMFHGSSDAIPLWLIRIRGNDRNTHGDSIDGSDTPGVSLIFTTFSQGFAKGCIGRWGFFGLLFLLAGGFGVMMASHRGRLVASFLLWVFHDVVVCSKMVFQATIEVDLFCCHRCCCCCFCCGSLVAVLGFSSTAG
jgi:hypothetical protein